jgi:hypothetical protein
MLAGPFATAAAQLKHAKAEGRMQGVLNVSRYDVHSAFSCAHEARCVPLARLA